MNKNIRVLFLGTPDFAVASLKVLIENGVHVVAVVTVPDKPQGRGKKLGTSAVKAYAKEVGLPVLQPTNLKSLDFLALLKSYEADLQVVVAFRMLPVAVWDMPPLGTFNLHASLLPQYRGAAPIHWAIINGEKETGVTTFFLKSQIDTGEIIYQEKELIYDDDNVGTLYERLMQKGAMLVLKTVYAIQKNNYPKIPQQSTENIHQAPKIFKNDCKIDWQQPAKKIKNFIRGLAPYPTAWSFFQGKTIKIFDVLITKETTNKPIGELYSDGKNYLRVNTNDDTLEILDLQIEGKKRMETKDFLRGFQVSLFAFWIIFPVF